MCSVTNLACRSVFGRRSKTTFSLAVISASAVFPALAAQILALFQADLRAFSLCQTTTFAPVAGLRIQTQRLIDVPRLSKCRVLVDFHIWK